MPPSSPHALARLRVSECFLSIQGEGPSVGTPAHFVRLQGCDVGCHWCDSKYTWAFEGGREIGVDDVLEKVGALGDAPLLVVTGGEPLAQDGIFDLLNRAAARWNRVEVETSGVVPPRFHHERLFYNVSPKLPSVTPRWSETWRHASAWAAAAHTTFKLVVGDDPDLADALRLLAEHRIPAERVMLMPEGLTDEQVRAHAPAVIEACKRHGFRISPRLHIWLWGAKRGV
jgi:7-carboxy-7-deazaguanine synthase